MLFRPAFLAVLCFATFVAVPSWAELIDLSGPDAEAEQEDLVRAWEEQCELEPSPENILDLAWSLHNLGLIERQIAKPAEALEHLSRALSLLEGQAPIELADTLEAKAMTLQDLDRMEESEVLLREVLETRQQVPEERTTLAATLDHLALNLLYQARYAEVAPLLEQALETAPEDDLISRARFLDHRGRLHHTLGSHSRAADAYREALALDFEDDELRLTVESQLAVTLLRLGPDYQEQAREGIERVADQAREIYQDTPYLAVPYINNLGALYINIDELEEAANSFKRSLEILEDKFGSDHSSLITALNSLGVAQQLLGDYSSAEENLKRAAELQARYLPETHLEVAITARNLARNAILAEKPEARALVDQATSIGLDLLDELIRNGSERERLNFLERFDLISLPCATADPTLIANTLIASKARLLDAMLAPTGPSQRPTWQEVQATLSAGSAFVDTCHFTSTSPEPREEMGAIVILPTGPPRWIPLGDSQTLIRSLNKLRQRLLWRSATLSGDAGPAPSQTLKANLKFLYQLYWAPIEEQLPEETQHIAYSPSGALHFLPLSALLDQEIRPLSTRYLQIATLASARDMLLERPSQSIDSNPWAVLTISDFPGGEAQQGDELTSLLSKLQPMPGTRTEAKMLRRIAPRGSSFLHGEKVTESGLRELELSPAVLHLGCHAFFRSDEIPVHSLPLDFDERSDLLTSGGLVLYEGANRRPYSPTLSPDDDLLYPAEISSLSLEGTRLVTLSSCNSGEGTSVSGEGVLGLRRAFSLAGAREVVVALWPVSDRSTPDFMVEFYQRALASDRPSQSLWQTQGDFLSMAQSDEEFELAVLRYAPFVLSQNAPLMVGPSIPKPDPPTDRRSLFIALATIPALLYLSARVVSIRRKRRMAA